MDIRDLEKIQVVNREGFFTPVIAADYVVIAAATAGGKQFSKNFRNSRNIVSEMKNAIYTPITVNSNDKICLSLSIEDISY